MNDTDKELLSISYFLQILKRKQLNNNFGKFRIVLQREKMSLTEQKEPFVPEEARKLLQQVISQKQTIMSCGLARIYTARSESGWVYSNIQGILCLVWDREMENTPFMRLFDVETFDLLFEAEMYIDFQKSFTAMTNYFFFFEFMNAFIGIQFANKDEALEFSVKVMTQSLKSEDMELEQQQERNQSFTKKKEDKTVLSGIKQGAKKLFNFFKKDKNQELEELQISKPISVKHDNSLQFDFKNNQLDFSNLDPEWLAIFEKAGISKKDLSDQDLAPIIFESVFKFQSHYDSKMQSQSNDSTQSNDQSLPNDQVNQQIEIPVENKRRQPTSHRVTLTKAPANLKPPSQNIPNAPPLNIPNAPPLNIPNAPPLNIPIAPPLNIPIPPPLDIATMSSTQNSQLSQIKQGNFDSSQVANKSSMLDQIKSGNFQLRKVEVNQKENKANLDVSSLNGAAQENLTAYLSSCIAERRKQLRKNCFSSSSENESSEDDD